MDDAIEDNVSALSKLKCCSRGKVHEILTNALKPEFKGKVIIGGSEGYCDTTAYGEFDTGKEKGKEIVPSGKVFYIDLGCDGAKPMEIPGTRRYCLSSWSANAGYDRDLIIFPYTAIC